MENVGKMHDGLHRKAQKTHKTLWEETLGSVHAGELAV